MTQPPPFPASDRTCPPRRDRPRPFRLRLLAWSVHGVQRGRQRARLVEGFPVFTRRIGVGDDAAAGVHVCAPIFQKDGADHDAEVETSANVEVAPVMEPGGNAARSRSTASRSERR